MSPVERPLRVLFLITDLGKGGAERFLLDLGHAFQKRGDVEFLIGALYDNNGYAELSQGIPVVQLDYQTFSLTRKNDYSRWARLLDDFKPDVVHTHRFLAEFLSGQHVRRDIAYVCHGHDNMSQFALAGPGTFFDRSRLMQWIEKRYLFRQKYRRVRTAFIANSAHTVAFYRKVLPRSMKKDVHLIHYGFDYDRFRASRKRELTCASPVRLVNVGSFVDKKNQKLILRIGEALARRGASFRIDLLGDGPNRAGLEAEVGRMGLVEQIRFHGNVDRVEDWLGQADIYLHTARYEPFGLVILEAMAAGLPSVIRDGLGDRELIVEGQNGHLLETENADAYADCIQALARDPQAYVRMSAFAIEFAARFDIGRAADRLVDFYRRWQAEACEPNPR